MEQKLSPAHRLISEMKSHSNAREHLRSRKLNAIPQIDVYTARKLMDGGKRLSLAGDEGECEFRISRRDTDLALLKETVSYMMESCVYPYSVHLPAYQLGDGERASEVSKALDLIIQAVDPALMVLHVSKPPLKRWGSEMKALLRDVPPDLVIALENVGVDGDKMRFPDRVPLVLDAIGDAPDNLGFCLDVTHVVPRDTTRGDPEAWETEIRETVSGFIGSMGARLRHMHLSNTRYDGEKRLQHLPFDQGFLDMAGIKDELRSSGFSGKCVLEFSHKRVGEGIEEWNSL